jgi:NADP-dependent 3-hydroxy acid dehydrogenase YdfG
MGIPYSRSSPCRVAGRLAGKAVAITGIGGGQGQVTAPVFPRSGTLVLGRDRKAEGVEYTRRRA